MLGSRNSWIARMPRPERTSSQQTCGRRSFKKLQPDFAIGARRKTRQAAFGRKHAILLPVPEKKSFP